MNLTLCYALALIAVAVTYSLIAWLCAYRVYKNHLQKKVRWMLMGAGIHSITASFDYWGRAYGRFVQMTDKIIPNQADPIRSFLTLALLMLGLMFFLGVIEWVSTVGYVDPTVGGKRDDDPEIIKEVKSND
jgi:uncharacterized BrkB/YihY/UPF0761 family membrane protein